eukprot:5008343-Pyramimonas_sp.AAC.1
MRGGSIVDPMLWRRRFCYLRSPFDLWSTLLFLLHCRPRQASRHHAWSSGHLRGPVGGGSIKAVLPDPPCRSNSVAVGGRIPH